MDKKRLSDIIPVFGGLLLILALLLLYRQFSSLREAQAMVASEQAAISSAGARLEELQKAEKQSGEINKQLAEFQRIMPQTPDEESIVRLFNEKAQDSGMRFTQVRFEERSNRQNYVEMPFKITFEGRYHGLLDLLYRIKKEQRAVRIDSIKIAGESDQLPRIKVEIAASCFYAKQ